MTRANVRDRRILFDAERAKYDLPAYTDEEWARVRRITHLRVAENVTLCQRAEDRVCLGEWLDDDPHEVGCPTCLEWMHA